ncbi:MAG TPA: GNAT family N-acetyltransferase [Thermoplasmata archaeon]|nr:GNAT family N-acetyltransferase [Thermoplasmata archaeon]
MPSPAEVLALYDAELRRDPLPIPGSTVEKVGPIVRVVGRENLVIYSSLTEANARSVVAQQAAFFRRTAEETEWKLFGHDRPSDLAGILSEEGFVPGTPETLVVLDLSRGPPPRRGTPGIRYVRVADAQGARDAAEANARAFGDVRASRLDQYLEWLRDPNQVLFVAYAEKGPVASGRIELAPSRSFAGLYGGGTAPEYRHRGIYRDLVAVRAEYAAALSYRYVTVDAQETSRPILERLGFVPLTTTRPWILRGAPAAEGDPR